MALRLFTVAVVLLWLGSVAWLCAVVWAPPGSRMARVDPREVYRVFFEWNDSTKMALLEDGRRRGELVVQAGSGPDPDTGDVERFLSLSGQIESYDEGGAAMRVDLFWKSVLSFSEEMDWRTGTLSLRIPGNDLSARLAFEAPADGGTAPPVRAEVKLGDRELLSLDPIEGGEGGGSPLGALGALGGLGVGDMLMDSLGPLDPSAMRFSAEARTGTFNLAGREIGAYLLVLRGEEFEQELRLYLSEAGEPLRIETDLGFEAVSELLVPLDAYERTPPRK